VTRGGTVLRIVAWRGYDDPVAAAPFLERHGIELDVAYIDADEDAITLLARAEPGTFDLVALDNRYLPVLVEDGLVSPLELDRIASAADCFKPFLDRTRIDGRVWAAPFIWGGHPMAYNACFVAEPPMSWLDVLKPEYEGRIVMLDGAIHQIIVWGRVLGYPNPTYLRTDELDRAIELAVSVKQRSRARFVGWDELPVALASGEAWLATAGWEAVSRFAAALGGEVRTTHPAEGAYPWLDSWAVVREAPNEKAAYSWIDWMLSPDAQAAVSRSLLCGTVNRRAVAALDPDVTALLPHDRIEERFADGPYVGLPARRATDGFATLADWHEAWERVRAA
jgi:spermidine/putrescine transport system substrate-binding protein